MNFPLSVLFGPYFLLFLEQPCLFLCEVSEVAVCCRLSLVTTWPFKHASEMYHITRLPTSPEGHPMGANEGS